MIKAIDENYDKHREAMVKTQIEARGIKDCSVLEAMLRVPRHLFVLKADEDRAYVDSPLPIMCGQTISQPYIVALMTEQLELGNQPGQKILEIGLGSGYQAAVLAAMDHVVYSIDRIERLANFAKQNLDHLPYGNNVHIHVGDGCLGLPEYAPYDGIIVAAAAPQIPQPLIDQLKPGAKLVIPVGSCFSQQMMQVFKTDDGKTVIRESIGCRFVPLIGKDGFK